ncbi:MAG: transcriptional repressor [Flavobacteriales bacterium]|nr:MAG: transcriptional repressor [Flavobacteriales bacterium]
MEQAEIQRNVSRIFCTFLEDNNQRKTPERLAVLNCIYEQLQHFTVESLYRKVKILPVNISRATVYNTLELLLDCDLITKHQFGKSIAQYEKSYQSKQHDHLICEDCEKVFEFCDPRIQQIQKTTEELSNLKISHHALNFYGHCKSWQENGECEHRTKGEI